MHHTLLRLGRRDYCLPSGIPTVKGPVFHVSSGFEPSGWQQRSQRSLSFVQLCIWALTRGRATRAMLMGTKWGVSPRWVPEGEEKHVFSCIHVKTWDPSFLPFLSSPFFSLSQTKGKQPCLLLARTLNQCCLRLDRYGDPSSVSKSISKSDQMQTKGCCSV